MAVIFYSPVIFVRDIEISKKFYISLFEFTIKHDFNTNIIFNEGPAIWQIDPGHEIAQKHPLKVKGDVRFELYFESDNLAKIEDKLMKYGVEFLHKVKEEPWGQRTFRVYDPDHHLIEIGETLPAFVNRMSIEGMSPQQIADKTGVPLQDVVKLLNP
ncbi:MAG: VOC family protein [Bacteroidales bacterium]|nr:VOC family protein [Bacteroidales bacterium]